MGDDGATSAEDTMMPDGQSRKEAAEQTPPSSIKIKSLRIGSWNVRTMYEVGKQEQIRNEMHRYNLDILGISETHWSQSGQRKLKTGELILYSGEEELHRRGVAMFLSKRVSKTLRGWEAHGPRIILASFTTNKRLNINIIQVYAPTNDAPVEEKDDFYTRLQEVVDKLPLRDVNVVMGDLNAKVGCDNSSLEHIMGKHGVGEVNDNGERLQDFCAFNRLVIGGTVFPHKKIHKTTWTSPDGRTENQIDHFCIASKFRRSLQDVRVMRGADVASDHHLVLAKVSLKLKKFKQVCPGARKKFQVSLLQDQSKKDEFSIKLTNRFQALQDLDDMEVEDHWSRVKEVFHDTCEEVLGRQKYESKPWISQESMDMVKERRKLKLDVSNSRTRAEKLAASERYGDYNKEVKKSLQKDRNAYLDEMAEKAEAAAADGHMKIVYQTTRILSGKWSKPSAPVKDRDGKTVFGQEGQLDRWREHFDSLLNRPPPENPPDILPARRDLDIETDPPDRDEIATAVRQMKAGKAGGPDHIPPEALKTDVQATVDILYPLFVQIWNEEKFPEEWKDGHLIKLPKKGDLTNCNNYRGITLLVIIGKVFNRIILNRMKFAVDEKLRDNQAGFRANRSCTDQIATLRIIIEQTLEWNSSAYINFVDYQKAFDSVDRTTLWKLMRHYGIPEKLVNLVSKSYDGTRCQVCHEGQLSDSFEIKTGVRQGCLLSPFLFNLAIDWVMRETTAGRRNGIQWTPLRQLDDLDYADDIALLSHSHQQMQFKTDEFARISKNVGLNVHKGKTKILKIGTDNDNPVVLEGTPLEEVDSFIYLGSIVDKLGGTEADVKARIGKARSAFTQLRNIWRSGKISLRTKLRLFNSNVKSVLLYGCETWKATDTVMRRVQTFINSCLRKILKVRWQDRVRNDVIWERTNQRPVAEEIKKRRWRWIGHTLRKPKPCIPREAMQWSPQGERDRKRPRETWQRAVERDRKQLGVGWGELSRIAQDRDSWKTLVSGLYPDQG